MRAEPSQPRSASEGYVTQAVVQSYLKVAEQHGMGQAELLARTGSHRADLEGRHGRVAGALQLRILRLFDELGIVPLPQAGGGFDDLHAFYPAFMTLLASSATMREALRHFVTYQPRAMGTLDRLTMKEDAERVLLVYDQTDTGRLSSACAFGDLMLANNIARHYDDRATLHVQIDILGRLPGRHTSWLSAADCRVRGDAPQNSWLLSGAALDQPFEFYNPHVARYARQQLDRQFQELNAAFSLATRVSLHIRDFLRAAPAKVDDDNLLARLCDSLGMSRWTLRRHLALESTSFSELLATQRCDEMRHLLAHSDLSIAEIGDQLGFSTPASLTRFAHHQLGMAPSEYRLRSRSAGPA